MITAGSQLQDAKSAKKQGRKQRSLFNALLKMHLAQTKAVASPTLDVEVCGLRVGDFKLVTFPGELTVEIGLNIKKAASDAHAHVSGYSNGYIYTSRHRVL